MAKTPIQSSKVSTNLLIVRYGHCIISSKKWQHVCVYVLEPGQVTSPCVHASCWGRGGGGSEELDGIPEHKSQEQVHESYDQETKNLGKLVLASKVVNRFTCAPAPPFIGRRRNFYIPNIPSNIRNIPSVNTYMNVFYIP
jgi:hypothetical protein